MAAGTRPAGKLLGSRPAHHSQIRIAQNPPSFSAWSLLINVKVSMSLFKARAGREKPMLLQENKPYLSLSEN